MKHLVILSTVTILLFLSFPTAACPANSDPQTIFGVRPTVEQFKAEILRADLVIRARVTEILFHRGGNHADEDVRIQVSKFIKGSLPRLAYAFALKSTGIGLGMKPEHQIFRELVTK